MLRSNLCDYADAYILVKGTITIAGVGDAAAARWTDERNKSVVFKKCATFTKCIIRINDTEIDNAQDIDTVMPMHNLIEYSDNYLKTYGSLWQYYKDEPNDNLANSESFKSEIKITQRTLADGNTKDVEIIVPLKHIEAIFGELLKCGWLINCKVNLILTWSKFYRGRKIWNKRYKTLCSTCNFINSRECKITSAIKIWF